MIALSVLAPYAAPLWAGFGAAAGTAAAAGSVWGSIGTAIYNGANWVGATLSSMTSGISKGISSISEGAFSKGLEEGVKGFADAFTGKAGALGVKTGIQEATKSALASAAGDSILKQTTDKIMNDIGVGTTPNQTLDSYNEQLNQKLSGVSAENLNLSQTEFSLAQPGSEISASNLNLSKTGLQAPSFAGQSLEQQTSDIFKGQTAKRAAVGTSLLDKASKVGKSLLSGEPISTSQPLTSVAPIVTPLSSFRGNASAEGSGGSAGGDFLSQGMLAMMTRQQETMQRGFGT